MTTDEDMDLSEPTEADIILAITMSMLVLHEQSNAIWLQVRDGKLTAREAGQADPWRKLAADCERIFPPDELVPRNTSRPSLADIIRRTFKTDAKAT